MSIRTEFERAFEEKYGEAPDAYWPGKPIYPQLKEAFLEGSKWMAKHAEQMILSELGHINNNSQRAYSWHEIQDLVVKMRSLAQELSR